MTWAERTVLITGASQGIGAHLAAHFAPMCRQTILVARNRDKLAAVAAPLQKAGAACAWSELDLRDGDAIRTFVEDRLETPVDLVIHNAADTTSKPFRETSTEEIDSLIRTNITGPLQLTRLLLPSMIQRGEGAVVHLSSLAGFKPNPAQTIYSASKGGVNALSDALRRELTPLGIRVTNLALPSVTLDGPPTKGSISVARVATMIERAVDRPGGGELFFSPVSRWLMRAYRAFPTLGEIRM